MTVFGKRQLLTDGNTVYPEQEAIAMVRLDQRSHGVLGAVIVEPDSSRGRADATFEVIADHAGAATDSPLFDRTARGTVEGMLYVFAMHMPAKYVVQRAIPGFSDHGNAGRQIVIWLQLQQFVVDHADA